MEKKNIVMLILGVVGGLIFSLGMCMCLLPEWGAFEIGVGFGIVGAILLLITLLVYLKKIGWKPGKINFKLVGKIVYGVVASLVFGLGMCMTLVFEGLMIPGIVVGVVGIVLLLFLIPMCFGWKESDK